MSRRESRDSDSRHHRSRFDREPSPKRVRRDGKTATSNLNLDSAQHNDRDQKHHRRVQDSLPLEAPPPPVPDPKIETVPLSKESDKKSNGYREGTKNYSDKIDAPRSRSLFQHDERAARTFRHRETTERDWWKDSKDRQSGRTTNRSSNNDDTKPRDEKTRGQGADHRSWRHDGSYKTEPDLKKRPSFRETKVPVDADDKSAPEVAKPSALGSEEKPPRLSDPQQRMKFQSRDRYGGGGFGGSNRGRDRFNGRQQGQSGGRVEKWKHDLYDEANKSPTSKNEEDQIAKVEALLAS